MPDAGSDLRKVTAVICWAKWDQIPQNAFQCATEMSLKWYSDAFECSRFLAFASKRKWKWKEKKNIENAVGCILFSIPFERVSVKVLEKTVTKCSRSLLTVECVSIAEFCMYGNPKENILKSFAFIFLKIVVANTKL